MAKVKFEHITKAFGETVAVRDLNLEINDKEFLVLVGPSGCGKTTTLRMLAGLEEPTQGKIYIDDRDITNLPPKDRDIAMVFQSYALYPHMNVYDNLAFGLRNRVITTGEKTLRSTVTLIMWTLVILAITILGKILGLAFGKDFYNMIIFGGISAFLLALGLYPEFRKSLTWTGIVFLAKFSGLAKSYIDKEKMIEERVKWAAEILEIQELIHRKPKQLSGGQRQRVALGRAMVREPKVFLMDEPLSNLDAKLRNSMRAELASLQSRLAITTVYVTHDQIEAMTLGHRIAVMNKGIIEQIGTPDEVYKKPQTLFVAGFIGTPTMNFVKGRIRVDKKEVTLETDELSIPLKDPRFLEAFTKYDGKEVVMGIRPENIKLSEESKNSIRIDGKVTFAEPIGSVTHIFVRIGEKTELTVAIEGYHKAERGEHVTIYLPLEFMHFFDAENEKRIDF